jgi:hypothetical protein
VEVALISPRKETAPIRKLLAESRTFYGNVLCTAIFLQLSLATSASFFASLVCVRRALLFEKDFQDQGKLTFSN